MSGDPMTEARAVLVPMLNPNEPDAVMVERRVPEGGPVTAGDVLCVLETSKSTEEFAAEMSGYVVGWAAGPGDMVNAGSRLCYIAPAPGWHPPSLELPPLDDSTAGRSIGEVPPGLRISQPALELARDQTVDLNRLPVGPLVTVAMVQALLGPGERVDGSPLRAEAIIVYGGGGHGRTLVDLVRFLGVWQLEGVVDQSLRIGTTVLGAPVLGNDDALQRLRADGIALAVNGVGGIARSADRVDAFERLASTGFAFPTLRHPSAVVEPSATLAGGVQVLAHAYVGSQASIGFGCLINTGAVVSHDCILAEYVNVSPGALIAGGVKVGANSLVGMGVTINLGVSIGQGARIGNSAVVKADVPPGHIVPAGSVWPARS